MPLDDQTPRLQGGPPCQPSFERSLVLQQPKALPASCQVGTDHGRFLPIRPGACRLPASDDWGQRLRIQMTKPWASVDEIAKSAGMADGATGDRPNGHHNIPVQRISRHWMSMLFDVDGSGSTASNSRCLSDPAQDIGNDIEESI